MKNPRIFGFFCLCAYACALASFSGCSIQKMAYNSASDMLAPYPKANPKPVQGNDPMIAITGENDPELVADFFPGLLKVYEILLSQNPTHEGLGIMTGELYVMYANAFIQTPAETLPAEQFDEQNAAYKRAQNFYMRGSGYVLASLDHKYKNFRSVISGKGSAAIAKLLAKCTKVDTTALYWAAAGNLGAFSLSPLDSKYLATLPGSLAMIERASVLDPGFSNGAIWEILMSFYAAAPDSLGGGRDKAIVAWQNALKYSQGKSPSTYISYARCFSIPAQDSAGFDENIAKALAIDPDSQKSNRLALTIAHRQALWLKAHKADYILE